jgi:hypothetical protein
MLWWDEELSLKLGRLNGGDDMPDHKAGGQQESLFHGYRIGALPLSDLTG